MVRNSTQAKKVAQEYIRSLKKLLRIKRAFVFGSAATGKMSKHSDIDLIVISDDFKKMNLMQRLVFLSRFRGDRFLDWPMDIFGYTEEEFNKLAKDSSMFSEAKKEGVVIK